MSISSSTSILKMFNLFGILIFIAAVSEISYCNITSTTCTHKELSKAYLDAAIDMILKAKSRIPSCNNFTMNQTAKAIDCADLQNMGRSISGVYEIWPVSRVTEDEPLNVYCDMETDGGGWTVIQRRGEFLTPTDYFFKDWESYKEGFGEIEEDFWLGNDNIFALTNQKLYSARFDLKHYEKNKIYAHYDKFWIDDELHNYTLHVSTYTGDAGDGMTNHDNQAFSTKDRDNDKLTGGHCAKSFKGAWWYNKCFDSHLNGLFQRKKYDSGQDGISWLSLKSEEDPMEWTEIKIRPRSFGNIQE